jgi:hypothetical protein
MGVHPACIAATHNTLVIDGNTIHSTVGMTNNIGIFNHIADCQLARSKKVIATMISDHRLKGLYVRGLKNANNLYRSDCLLSLFDVIAIKLSVAECSVQ